MTKGFTLKSFILIVGILLVLALLILTFSNKEKDLSDVDIVEDFYNQYINNQFVDTNLITEDLKVQLDNSDISAVLCSSSFDDIAIEKVETNNDFVEVYLKNLENPINVYTIKQDGESKINNIVCTIPLKDEYIEEQEEEQQEQQEEEQQEQQEITNEIIIPEAAKSLVNLAKNDLAQRLSVDINNIITVRLDDVNFSDTSLGLSKPGEMYAQVITPGYIIVLEVNNKYYRYHTDKSSVVVFVTED
ncbi:MAG: hypothetical protein BWY34_00132 [Parcubacteria group bacterium ADurb.Bin247]|jgi:hypothetical protein|nr:MAG: hypothetical protein BWY34_00132 [Parcubacteria group bacterium ADurb.Bin247]HQB18656.1 hypothetical protein [Candidatus Pacearchaeota archaeon]